MSGCWLWTGAYFWDPKRGNRYGKIWVKGKLKHAHRVSWELHNGPIPDGLFVLHKCDNHACVNPAHLYPGTQAQNVLDTRDRGRMNHVNASRGEKHLNAKLTVEQAFEVRSLAVNRAMPQTKIAAVFGISQSVVGRIARGEAWRNALVERYGAF